MGATKTEAKITRYTKGKSTRCLAGYLEEGDLVVLPGTDTIGYVLATYPAGPAYTSVLYMTREGEDIEEAGFMVPSTTFLNVRV